MEKPPTRSHKKKRENTPENHLTHLLKKWNPESQTVVAQFFTIRKDDTKHRSEDNDHRQRITGTISNRTRGTD